MIVIIVLLIIAIAGFLWSLLRVAAEADRIEREIWEDEKDADGSGRDNSGV